MFLSVKHHRNNIYLIVQILLKHFLHRILRLETIIKNKLFFPSFVICMCLRVLIVHVTFVLPFKAHFPLLTIGREKLLFRKHSKHKKGLQCLFSHFYGLTRFLHEPLFIFQILIKSRSPPLFHPGQCRARRKML